MFIHSSNIYWTLKTVSGGMLGLGDKTKRRQHLLHGFRERQTGYLMSRLIHASICRRRKQKDIPKWAFPRKSAFTSDLDYGTCSVWQAFRNILVTCYFLHTSLFTLLPVYFLYLVFGSPRDEIIQFTSFAESLSPYVSTARSHIQTPSMIISYAEIYPQDG